MSAVDPRFGPTLLRMIAERGMYQCDVANAANLSKSYLSEIIRSKKQPTVQVASALDRALGANGALRSLLLYGVTDDESGAIAAIIDDPRRAGPDAVRALQLGLTALRIQDDLLGSHAMLAPAATQMQVVCRLADEVVGTHRNSILFVAGQWAQFLGWLSTSLGQWADARKWFAQALEWAVEIDNPDLIATAVSYQAHVAWLTLRPGPAVGLSQRALREPSVHPCQRGYDYYQLARALARVGEYAEARRMIELGQATAAEAIERVDDRPPWQYYRDPWMWTLELGLAQYYTGRVSDLSLARVGLDSLRAGLDGMPEEMRGADWAGEYMVYAATAATRVDELDEASALLDRAHAIATATNSPRLKRLVHQRERRLGQVRPDPPFRSAA